MNTALPSPRSVLFNQENHDISDFDCGNDLLNQWLLQSASHARQTGTANTYVFVRNGKVIAFYSLSAHRIQSRELPPTLAHGSPHAVPAYLIGKLAVTKSEQGKSVGQTLLTDAFLRICRATDLGPGARFIAVDAIDDNAIKFYKQEKIHSSPFNPHHMFIKMSTARKIVTRG